MKKEIKTDLLVVGGGIAGICAAIAAARNGLDVVLINDRSVLGGNASSEIGVVMSGASHHGLNPAVYAKETGIAEEIRLRAAYYGIGGGYGFYSLLDAVFFDMIYAEKNITLLLNTFVYDCDTEGRRITRARARHSVNNNEFIIMAQNYIDATGNGTLAYESGAEYKIGREGKDEYNEFWAPDTADKYTMGNSIYFETEDAGHEVIFKAPDFAYDISEMEFLKDINKPENFRGLSCFGPHWAYEFGGQMDILEDHDNIELELRKLIYGIWDYVKNSGKYPKAKTRYLKRVYAKAGTRESRRFIGDYVLNENDIEQKVNFEDSVAIGGWPMDIHAPLGIYDKLPASNFVSVTGTYNIPFRSLYSKDIDNLMLAGRNISASHIALGSTRVMATCGAIGQAVGTAAYISKKYNADPREIYKSHIKKLQQILIDDDQTILHIRDKNETDVCVCASSTQKYENINTDEYILLERDYALAFMADSKYVDSIKLKFRVKADTVLNYKLLTGTHPETYLPESIEKMAELPLTCTSGNWVTVPIEANVGKDGKIYLVLECNSNIEIAVAKKRVLGAVTLRMHTKESHDLKNHDSEPLNEEKTGYTFCDHWYERERNILFKDILPEQHVYEAENILNGFSRPYGTPNLWIAADKCPQSVILNPNKDLNELSIILNDNLDEDSFGKMPPGLAKDLDITIAHEGGICRIKEDNNYKRLLKYRLKLKNVTEIKITVNETYGENASIYAVRMN